MPSAPRKPVRPAARTTSKSAKRSNARVQKYRDKMRAAGMRQIQMWVPDTRDPKVRAEIRRQCLRLRDDPQEKQILDEIEAVTDFDSWK